MIRKDREMWEEQKVDTASILRISEQWAAWYHQRIEFKRKKNYVEYPGEKYGVNCLHINGGEFLILVICISHVALRQKVRCKPDPAAPTCSSIHAYSKTAFTDSSSSKKVTLLTAECWRFNPCAELSLMH
jgi:hypothetical protein